MHLGSVELDDGEDSVVFVVLCYDDSTNYFIEPGQLVSGLLDTVVDSIFIV